MDALTLLLTAMSAGAGAIAKETVTEATKDAYKALKALLQKKVESKPDSSLVLRKYDERPLIWQEPLKEVLTETKSDQDNQIIQAAQILMGLIEPKQAQVGKYNVVVHGSIRGFVQGDNANVTMHFDEDPLLDK